MHYRTLSLGGGGEKRPNLIEPYLSFKTLSTFLWLLDYVYLPQNMCLGLFSILFITIALVFNKLSDPQKSLSKYLNNEKYKLVSKHF